MRKTIQGQSCKSAQSEYTFSLYKRRTLDRKRSLLSLHNCMQILRTRKPFYMHAVIFISENLIIHSVHETVTCSSTHDCLTVFTQTMPNLRGCVKFEVSVYLKFSTMTTISRKDFNEFAFSTLQLMSVQCSVHVPPQLGTGHLKENRLIKCACTYRIYSWKFY